MVLSEPSKNEIAGYSLKGLRYFIFLLTVFIPSVATAISTQYGESGLISVPTTGITERGIYNVSVWGNSSQKKESNAIRLPLSISMGIGIGWEFFSSYPDILFANQVDGSMGNFGSVGIKFRTTGGADSNLRTVGSAFLRQTVSEEKSLSGLRDLGMRVMMSYSLAKADVHLNAGYLKVASPSTKKYNNEVLFGSAVEISIADKMRLFMELDGNTNRDGGSSRIELSPGMQYYILPSISMMGGVGFGLTDIGPDYRVVVGLTYTSGAGRYVRAIPIIPGSRERYAAMAETSIEELMPELPMETKEVLGKEIKAASAPEGVPSMEGLEAFQAPMPAPVSQAPLLKPDAKEALSLEGLMGSTEMEAVSMELPMPMVTAAMGKPVVMENIPMTLEGTAEASADVFTPPMPVMAKEEPAQKSDKARIGEIEVIQDVSPQIPGEQPVIGKRAIYYEVWFFPEKTSPSPYVQGVLDKLAAQVKKSGERLILKIDAHTDSGEKTASHKKLSYDRADGIKDYLVKRHGFDPDAFVLKGYGNERPATTKKTAEERRKNRRADIVAYSIVEGMEAAEMLPSPAMAPVPVGTPPVSAESPAPSLPVPVVVPVAAGDLSDLSAQREKQPAAGKKLIYKEILFFAEKPDLSPFVQGILDKMAEQVKKSGKRFVVKVDGHADGQEGMNLTELSFNRANGVKDYLIKKYGFDENAFVIKGYGNERPVAPSDTPEGMKKNRRVEITVFEAKD